MGRDWNMALGRGVEVGDHIPGKVAVGDAGGHVAAWQPGVLAGAAKARMAALNNSLNVSLE